MDLLVPDAPRPQAEPATAGDGAPDRERSRRRAALEVLAFSLAVTASAALVATAWSLATDARWSLAFVVLRWCLVAVLLATPLLHQAIVRLRPGAPGLPMVLRTPATALVLTVESIGFDILSARLG